MLLTQLEIRLLSGGYVRPKDQVDELRKQGYIRARIGKDGNVILERDHYSAVCSGNFAITSGQADRQDRPKIRPPIRKAA